MLLANQNKGNFLNEGNEEKSYNYAPMFQFFCFLFSLPLILTLLAASISHFLIAALNFSCFFLQ